VEVNFLEAKAFCMEANRTGRHIRINRGGMEKMRDFAFPPLHQHRAV